MEDSAPKYDNRGMYRDLHTRLISGDFPPGSKLKPAILQDRYGCSANTVRDVLFQLAGEGLADFRDQRGFRVPALNPRRLSELAEMRILLEQEGALRSLRRGGVAWEARLTAAHHQLEHIEMRIRASEIKETMLPLWQLAETEFHQTLIAACGSEALKDLHTRVFFQFRQQLIQEDRTFAYVTENILHHKGILTAVVEGDAAALSDRISAHLSRNLLPD